MDMSCLPYDILALIINLAIVNRTPSRVTNNAKLAIVNHKSSYVTDNASHDLKTRIDQDSLQRAPNVLTSPHIGLSVRNIRLDMNNRPKMLADDVGSFAEVARTRWNEAPYPWYSACKELEARDLDEDEPEEDIEQ